MRSGQLPDKDRPSNLTRGVVHVGSLMVHVWQRSVHHTAHRKAARRGDSALSQSKASTFPTVLPCGFVRDKMSNLRAFYRGRPLN